MLDFDLNTLTLSELNRLKLDVTRAIASYESRTKAAARAELEAVAKAHGFKLADLLDGSAPAKTGKAAGVPKYAHPENPAITWTGRGRQPGWVRDALAAGRSLDDFLIG
ncbi:H-NS histone family protein [Sinirhodobacter populi]|uniref:H-NS histone family protein n=1 Tax=Paenirhodobacter populi TaxID=2306993 RepID=A0A443JY16_9RHOB|nr:H-NS histone family protein [Sinirhodobacter populi]RWR25413.1 H-NS histone family protein [Sinirhodobacter populi]